MLTEPAWPYTQRNGGDFADLQDVPAEAGSDPRGHLGVTWGVYLCAGKPPLADIILSHPPELTRCDSVIGLAIPAMSGHIQNRGTDSRYFGGNVSEGSDFICKGFVASAIF